MSATQEEYTRGVLYAKKSQEHYVLERLSPSKPVATFIETFWLVNWDLPNEQEHIQQNIPDPCINMVFEAGKSRLVGAVSKRYSAKLAGKGQIFGVKFRPGGFFAMSGLPAHEITDRSSPLTDVFMPNIGSAVPPRLIEKILTTDDINAKAEQYEAWLCPFIAQQNWNLEAVKSINNIVDLVNHGSHIVRVEQLSSLTNLSIRALQRRFKSEVGISPKWLIRKCRIQEVLNRLEQGQHNWQEVMTHIGYFDQAHFIKDFKELIGVTPSQYLKGLT